MIKPFKDALGLKLASEWAICIAVALCSGALCLWKITDPDIFGYLVLGSNILSGVDISIDQWTYTIGGSQWSPFHWLTYVLTAATFSFTGYEGLSILCGLMVATWIFLISQITLWNLPSGRARRLAIIFLPFLSLIICCWRLRFKADLISLSLFALFVLILSRKVDLRPILAKWILLTALLFWSNFHNGTYPLGVLLFSSALLTEKWENKNLLWLLLALVLWFANPSGISVLPAFLSNTLFYGERTAAFPNIDLLPVTIHHFNFASTLWSYYMWVLFTICNFAVLGWCFTNKRRDLPGPYKNLWFSLILSLIFLALTFRNARSIIYQVTFMMPIICTGIKILSETIRKQSPVRQKSVYALAVIAVLFVTLKMIPDHFIFGRGPFYGVGLFPEALPYKALGFIKKHHPQPNILNPIDMGALIELELPQYKVAIDWRDYPFISFLKELKTAIGGRANFDKLVKKYRINVIIDYTAMTPHYSRLLDPHQWVLVFEDRIAIVYARKTPENSEIIAAKTAK